MLCIPFSYKTDGMYTVLT